MCLVLTQLRGWAPAVGWLVSGMGRAMPMAVGTAGAFEKKRAARTHGL